MRSGWFCFQIQSFNGKQVFIMFLPFHNTKIFARLLSILQLKGTEYDWVREYGKMEVPIPFERLVTQCFSKNHSVLQMICQNTENVIKVGFDFLLLLVFLTRSPFRSFRLNQLFRMLVEV